MSSLTNQGVHVSSEEIMMSIVLPTIIFCIEARQARQARKIAAERDAQQKRKEQQPSAKNEAAAPPPLYSEGGVQTCGTSPPPSYEDALLDEFFQECMPEHMRASSSNATIRRDSIQSRMSRHSSVRSSRDRAARRRRSSKRRLEYIV